MALPRRPPRSLLLPLAAGLAACAPPQTLGPAPDAAAAAPPAERLPADIAARQAAHHATAAHAELAALAGEWELAVAGPDGAALGSGRASAAVVHGGLFLRLDVALELVGETVTLTGYLGQHAPSGTAQALWLSDLDSGMTLLSGGGALRSGGLVLAGRSAEAQGRSIWRQTDDDTLVVESRGPGPDGVERLLRRTTWRRAGPTR